MIATGGAEAPDAADPFGSHFGDFCLVSVMKGLSSRRCFTQLRHLLLDMRQKMTRLGRPTAVHPSCPLPGH